MSKDLTNGGRDLTNGGRGPGENSPPPARDPLRPAAPKRFYKSVTVGEQRGGWSVLLDGKPVRTPAKRAQVVPSRALAEAMAAEWEAQTDRIEPASMHLARIVNSAIDAVALAKDEVAADVVRFASSDLLCYRTETPSELVRRQRERWDPVLAWSETALAARFVTTHGLMHVTQPDEALAGIAAAVARFDTLELAGLHVMTTLTGSALLALAHALGHITGDEAWAMAHVDEDYQIELWGADHEAEIRRAARRAEFDAASRLVALCRK